jgi:hypothetical protein
MNRLEYVPNPCKRDCPRRNSTCHSECKDYEKYTTYLKELHKVKLDTARIDMYISTHQKGRK